MNKISTQTFDLPKHIISLIKDFIWGNKKDWIKKYNIFLTQTFIPFNPKCRYIYMLNPCLYQRRDLKETDIEENFYCPVCGEKTLYFPFLFNSKSEIECMCIY